MVSIIRPGERIHTNTPGVDIYQIGDAITYDQISSLATVLALRKVIPSYTGNLAKLRRVSDSATQDIGFTPEGDFDTAAAATFIGVSSATFDTIYDQSGNGKNATQTTTANQPAYVANVQNGHPIARFDGTNDCMIVASLTLPTFISVLDVAKFTTAKVLFIEHGPNANTNSGFYLNGTVTQMFLFDRSAVLHYAQGSTNWMTANWSVISAVYNGTHLVRRNGSVISNVTVTGSALANTNVTATLNIASRNQTGAFGQGDLAELVIANAVWSATDYAMAEYIANGYWGVF